MKATTDPPLRYRFQGDQAAYFLSINHSKKHHARSEERGKDVRWRLVDVSRVLRDGATVSPIGSLIGRGIILPDVRDLCLRLHGNVLAIALANKVARIAWNRMNRNHQGCRLFKS